MIDYNLFNYEYLDSVERLKTYVNEILIPNEFEVLNFDDKELLAFNEKRNIVFHVGEIHCFKKNWYYFQQPVNDGKNHDIRFYSSLESCYPGKSEFPKFTPMMFLSLVSFSSNEFEEDLMEVSLRKASMMPSLWNAIGEENRQLFEELKDQNSSEKKLVL